MKRSTKTSLLMSVVAMLLCVSMLVGSTFAWFTDSVTATNNVIVAGNLDVELYYQNDETTAWEKATTTSNIFKTNTLWEPGHVEVIKLKVVNEGTLALKYNLGVNIASETGSINIEGNPFKLSDHIKFGVVEGDQTYTREQAVAAVESFAAPINKAYTVADKLDPANTTNDNDEKIVTLVVYMPETVGNVANYGKGQNVPTINLGLNVLASQLMQEEDSFGNDYDEFAYPITTETTVPANTTTETPVSAGDYTVNVPAGADEGVYTVVVSDSGKQTNASGQTTLEFDLSLLKDGHPVEAQAGVTYPVEVNVGTGLDITEVTHKGVAVVFTYDAVSGIVSFETDSFSPFAIVYSVIPEGSTVKIFNTDGTSAFATSLAEAVANAGAGATVKMMEDATLTETLVIDKDIVLDLAGFEIDGDITTLIKLTDGTSQIKNGSIKNVKDAATTTYYSIYMAGDAVAEIKDVEIVTTGVCLYMTENAKVTELNADLTSYMNANGYCTFDTVSLYDNARIDAITGGEYNCAYTDEFIQAWFEDPSHYYSGNISYTIQLNGEGASIGEISGGTFLGVMDKANNGTPIHVNNGKVELISGGYFGFAKKGLSNPIRLLFVNSGTDASIDKVTGGTFEKGSLSAGYGCDFAAIVDNSGCQIVDTGSTVDVDIQFSTKVTTYTLNVVEVVAK